MTHPLTDDIPKVNDRRIKNNLIEVWTGLEWIVQPKEKKLITHPLTDEMIDEIVERDQLYQDDLRAAADWQLEQVIDWIEQYLTAGDVIALDLKKAMRPQENN